MASLPNAASKTRPVHTMVAVSSPPGASPRALIRLSGPDAHDLAQQCLERELAPSHYFQHNALRLSDTTLAVLAARYEAPHTYTGEDMIELQLPGHPALLEDVLQQFVALGALPAEPGEFTFRAYLNRKMDLTRAEGIAATISAVSDAQLRAASMLREGRLGALAQSLVNDIARSLALVEAGIDFTDQEGVTPIAPNVLSDHLASLDAHAQKLLQQHRNWSQVQALPLVVLGGRPSAGKSTLFNALLGHPRALTHDAPGTTRDVLREPLKLPTDSHGNTIEIMLADLAGLDDARSALDQQVQAAVRRTLAQADLILDVNDGSDSATLPLHEIAPPHVPRLRVRTKVDLHPADDAPADASVSAYTGEGMDSLKAAIARALADRLQSTVAQTLTLQPRHHAALRNVVTQIENARALLEPQRDSRTLDHAELIAGALRSALDDLACLGGAMTPDDVIGKVFATFCIGK